MKSDRRHLRLYECYVKENVEISQEKNLIKKINKKGNVKVLKIAVLSKFTYNNIK